LKPETISDGATRNVVILAEADELTITWSRFSPGERRPDLHVHHGHTDAFYVLDGELTFELGPRSERHRVGPGGFVAVPPHVAHSFVNDSGGDARWLNFHAPDCGFADFLRTLREGTPGEWDSFAMPADGGVPAERAVVLLPGDPERAMTVPGFRVVEDAVHEAWLSFPHPSGEVAVLRVAD
jgi:quercetin dioxygenase-like cupin family protein